MRPLRFLHRRGALSFGLSLKMANRFRNPPQVGTVTLTVISTTEIDVSWAAVPHVTSYLVERSANGTTGWSSVGTPLTNSYHNTGLTAGTRYYYRVSAVSGVGTGPPSAVANNYTLPAQVGTVTVTAASTTQLNLTWGAITSATSYLVEQSANGTTGWASAGTPGTNAQNVTGLTAGTRYYYRVSAVNPGGTGAVSATANNYTLPAQVGTVTPTVISSSEIDLAWAAITSATSYIVERSPNGTTGWASVYTPATNAQNDTGLTAGTQYFYRVSAVNPGGTGAVSATANATTNVGNFVSDTFALPANFVLDTITDTDAVLLQNHTGETGATWSKHSASATDATIKTNRLNKGAVDNAALYTASGTPGSADYEVEADFYSHTIAAGIANGLTGRALTAAETMYHLRYSCDNTRWELFKAVAGSYTSLGTGSQSLSNATSYHAILLMRGSSIRSFIDGIEIITGITDTAVTAAGLLGVRLSGVNGAAIGQHLDNLKAHPSLLLRDHVGETGATWTLETGGDARLFGGRVHSVTDAGIHSASGTPASADYDVSADLICTTAVGSAPQISGRINGGSPDMYFVDYAASSTNFTLQKRISGSNTTLGTYTDAAFTAGVTRSVMLRMRGSAISVLVDGVVRIGPVTDTGVTAVGKAGLSFVNAAAAGELIGYRADNFVATNA